MDTPNMATAALHSYPAPPPPPPMSMAMPMPAMPAMPQYPSTSTPHTTPQQQQQQQDEIDRARAYKSRNKRPCDFCRYKKAACHLETAPPCELCIRYNKECTFVESPAKRRRPNTDGGGSGSEKRQSVSSAGGLPGYSSSRNNSISMTNGNSLPTFSSGPLTGGMDLHADMMSWHNGMAPFQMQSLQSMGMNSGMAAPDFPLDPAFYQEPMAFEAFEPMSAGSMNTMDMKTPQHQQRGSMDFDISPNSMSMQLPVALSQPVNATSGEPSLDQQPSSNATIVGLSGESDPYLLSRYRYDQYNEASFQQVRMRKMNDGPVASDDVPAFFTIQHNALASKAQPSEKPEVLDRYRREIDEIINEQVGKRLIRLFFKYVQPYFPVLSREGGSYLRDEDGVRNPSTVPTCVLAAIYGHALPFCAWDEQLCVDVYTPPSPEALFRIAWYSAQAMCHTPSLAVVQAFLLMVQRRPTNKHVSDTPFKGIMWTNAVSIAQSLGLNRDPSDWPLPEWEIRHRRRLAWATYVQDKWLALNAGRSSHIHADDWDVEMLTEDDFAELDKHASGLDTPGSLHRQHFIKLCELSLIVDDILRSMFSLRATKELQNDLDATLETAKPLRMRLSNWYHSLPEGLLSHRSAGSPENGRRRSSPHELDGNGSLHLAYITANIELFRAMLRPQAMDPNEPAVGALRSGAIGVAREVFEFLEGLNARELEAFWASYSRTNFTIASSFILLLFVTAPNLPDAHECLNLLLAWRSLLRIKSRSCDLLNLALLRLDAVFVAGIDKLIELSPAALQAWAESGHGKG